MHIFNKSIFDCINEIIDKHRPYGLMGQPFPYKAHPKSPPISPFRFKVRLNV